jgi:hypothetical protein
VSIVDATKDDFNQLRKLGFANPQMDSIISQMESAK